MWTAVHREDVGVDCEICLNREINVLYHCEASYSSNLNSNYIKSNQAQIEARTHLFIILTKTHFYRLFFKVFIIVITLIRHISNICMLTKYVFLLQCTIKGDCGIFRKLKKQKP